MKPSTTIQSKWKGFPAMQVPKKCEEYRLVEIQHITWHAVVSADVVTRHQKFEYILKSVVETSIRFFLFYPVAPCVIALFFV